MRGTFPACCAWAARGAAMTPSIRMIMRTSRGAVMRAPSRKSRWLITVALTRSGALADGVVDPGDILVLQTSQFTVGP